jgi:hypothetical protein
VVRWHRRAEITTFPPSRTATDADDRVIPVPAQRRHPAPEPGTAGPAGHYPAPVLAAAVLAAEGVSFVLVGSAALWLHGQPVPVGDADVVIEPGAQNLLRLGQALDWLALQPRAVPPVRAFPVLPLASVTTSYGRIDCLLERGRIDWERLRQPAVRIPVADAGVLVAARAEILALRRRFKGVSADG